jgi:hypothetical protein
MARVASADGRGWPEPGVPPRNSPSHDSISRSSRGGFGPGVGLVVRGDAVALFTALRTAFLALANRVVGGSAAG